MGQEVAVEAQGRPIGGGHRDLIRRDMKSHRGGGIKSFSLLECFGSFLNASVFCLGSFCNGSFWKVSEVTGMCRQFLKRYGIDSGMCR